MQQLYWKGCSNISYEAQDKITNRLKQELDSIRMDSRKMMRESMNLAMKFPADRENSENMTLKRNFTDTVRQASIDCTKQMVGLAQNIMHESMNALVDSPPCSFTVAAIGSVARGEATPYSDLEYIFILEKKTQETVEYFEKLAMTSYFMIGNLRETKLSYMAIDELSGWFDDKSINGLKFDGLAAGAGNIPTGNGSLDTEIHYIVTPQPG